jgi:hypothetical protein
MASSPRIDKLDLVNVRSIEGAGTTTLTSSDNRIQIFNLSAARTCILPSSGVKAGEKCVIKKSDATAKLTISCANAASATSPYIPSSNVICYLDSKFAYAEFIALQDNPTTPDHWDMNFRFIEKEYLAGNTYNSVALTLSGTNYSSTVRGVFIPYQHFDGTWRLRFNFRVNTSSVTSITIAISGVFWKNTAGFYQAYSVVHNGGSALWQQNLDVNNGNVSGTWASAATVMGASGDAELDSKPTWAY